MIVTNYIDWKRVNESEDEEFDIDSIDLDSLDLDSYDLGDSDGDGDVKNTLGLGTVVNLLIDCSSSIAISDIIYTVDNYVIPNVKANSINLIMFNHHVLFSGNVEDATSDDIAKILNGAYQGGGDNINSAYEDVLNNKWNGNTTYVITDGYVDDHAPGQYTGDLAKRIFTKESKFLILGALKGDLSPEMERRLVYPVEKIYPPNDRN